MIALPTGLDATESADRATVADDLVEAALRAAEKHGADVADVPVIAIAREAGLSRSTLLRRLGGSRIALDDAVRAAGIDPGGQAPVRIRALDAAATLISDSGLAAATLEAVADRTGCSVQSIYTAFGSRDELLRIMFERHSPVPDFEDVLAGDTGDLTSTVRRIYEVLTHALNDQPRVAPAMIAEVFNRPSTPAVQTLITHSTPRVLAVIGNWLTTQIHAGTIRDMPVILLIQQLVGPIAIHLLVRPIHTSVPGVDLPDLNTVCDVLADAFVRAVAATPADPPNHQATNSK
jgi:AcrR family transcriptional regulator